MCKFGSVVDELDQRINLTFSQMEYLKYGYTKFKVLSQPKYKLDEYNELVIEKLGDTFKPVVQFPAGTLECMTETIQESMTLNYKTIDNYIGCTAVKADGSEEVIPARGDEEHPIDNWYNRTVSVKNAPVVPRFKVSDASAVDGVSSIAVGTYELRNAKGGKATATYNDVWYETTKSADVLGETNWVDKFFVEDVLLFIKRNATRVPHGELDSYKPSKGEFIIETEIGGIPEEDDVPIIGPLTAFDNWCRILYCYNEKLPLAQLAKIQSLDVLDSLVGDGGWTVIIDDPEVEGVVHRYHRYCGFIYRAMMKEHNNITDTDMSQEFVHFFRTRKLDSGYEVPVLDYTELEIDEGSSITAKDVAWHNFCEKYPWDCNTWYSVTGSLKTKITLDPNFKIGLDESRMYKYLVHSGKQYDLDDNGNLQEDPSADRHIQYMLSMLQIDAKHAKISATTNFIDSILGVLRTHFDNLGNSRTEMFANTKLYFEAFKSIGYGEFRVGPDVTEKLQLDISVKLRLHVSSATAQDAVMRDSIKGQIVYIIDTKLQKGYLNLNEVANQVMSDLAGTVSMVDVLGVNGRTDIQTLRSLDSSVRPHLKPALVLLDDGSIDVTRGLELEFVVDD